MVDAPDRKHDVLMQGREPSDVEGHNVLGQARAPERMEDKEAGGRPPRPGELVGNKQPPYDVTGLDALSPLLARVEFPATRAEVIERIGEARIAIDKLHTRSVREVLAKVAPTTFRSSNEVEDAVRRAWDQIAPPPDFPRGSHRRQGDDLSGRTPD